MKRLIIICEGQTEVEFCKILLVPMFAQKNIFVQTPLIKVSGGGIVKWPLLKKQIIKHLHETDVFVTTFIDYYGIHTWHLFPNWAESKAIADKGKRLDYIESSMKSALSKDISFRFIPYIQLHEFEGLLFNNIESFDANFKVSELKNRAALVKIIEEFPNSELINDSPQTAPSKRLDDLIDGYSKPVFGPLLAESIGLERIRLKSPRFDSWITNLTSL